MALKDFFVGRAVVFSILLLIGFCIFAYRAYAPVGNGMPAVTEERAALVTGFAWEFEDDETLNPDGGPQTNVFLSIAYADGSSERRLIDTTAGSCNALPDTDEDSALGTASIQCYYAGFGYRFKITEGEGGYLVRRQEFEEASPEYVAPAYEYETVSEIRL